jgi:ABC-type uncharacterized transport system involved in gliding motility auxiliary subunit
VEYQANCAFSLILALSSSTALKSELKLTISLNGRSSIGDGLRPSSRRPSLAAVVPGPSATGALVVY